MQSVLAQYLEMFLRPPCETLFSIDETVAFAVAGRLSDSAASPHQILKNRGLHQGHQTRCLPRFYRGYATVSHLSSASLSEIFPVSSFLLSLPDFQPISTSSSAGRITQSSLTLYNCSLLAQINISQPYNTTHIQPSCLFPGEFSHRQPLHFALKSHLESLWIGADKYTQAFCASRLRRSFQRPKVAQGRSQVHHLQDLGRPEGDRGGGSRQGP